MRLCVLRSRSSSHACCSFVHSYTRTHLRALLWVHRFQFILSFSRFCCYCCLLFFFLVNNNENTLKHAGKARERTHRYTHTFITQRACTRVLWHFASVFVCMRVCLLTFHYFCCCWCCWREKKNLKGKKHSHCAQTLWPHYVSKLKMRIIESVIEFSLLKQQHSPCFGRARSVSLTHTHAWITQSTKFSHFFTRARERATLKHPRCSESFSRLDGPTTMWPQRCADKNTSENTN